MLTFADMHAFCILHVSRWDGELGNVDSNSGKFSCEVRVEIKHTTVRMSSNAYKEGGVKQQGVQPVFGVHFREVQYKALQRPAVRAHPSGDSFHILEMFAGRRSRLCCGCTSPSKDR